ncbi:hypothetical protein D3C73_1342220 [compost metagenome]
MYKNVFILSILLFPVFSSILSILLIISRVLVSFDISLAILFKISSFVILDNNKVVFDVFKELFSIFIVWLLVCVYSPFIYLEEALKIFIVKYK